MYRQVTENLPNKEERTWAMLCHFSVLSMFVFPFGNILAPLIIWLIKKEEMPFVENQAKEVLNFQISITIYLIVAALLIIILVGIPLLIGIGIFNIVITIIAAIKANEGKNYRYPINLRIIK
ncbi:MAG: DUF4870 domain-containing protein [Verrucomicrobiales bacterium]